MNDFLQSLRNGQAEKQRSPKTRKSYDNSYHYSSPSRYQSYNNSYPNARNPQMKRQPAPQQPQTPPMPAEESSTVIAMLAEAIESLSRHIESLANNQDYLVTVHERTADILERQALAIEKIVAHLNIGPGPVRAREPHHEEDRPPVGHRYVTPAREPEPQHKEPVITETRPETAPESVRPAVRKRKRIVSQKPKASNSSRGDLMSREAIMEIIQTMREDGATYDQVASRLIELGQPTFSGRGEWHAQTIHRLCSRK